MVYLLPSAEFTLACANSFSDDGLCFFDGLDIRMSFLVDDGTVYLDDEGCVLHGCGSFCWFCLALCGKVE